MNKEDVFVYNINMKILLADIMYNKNISARQMATLTGISKSTINNIANEVHSPTMDNGKTGSSAESTDL